MVRAAKLMVLLKPKNPVPEPDSATGLAAKDAEPEAMLRNWSNVVTSEKEFAASWAASCAAWPPGPICCVPA